MIISQYLTIWINHDSGTNSTALSFTKWAFLPFFIELDDGKFYRKTLCLMVKTMVSCRFSLKPIQWLFPPGVVDGPGAVLRLLRPVAPPLEPRLGRARAAQWGEDEGGGRHTAPVPGPVHGTMVVPWWYHGTMVVPWYPPRSLFFWGVRSGKPPSHHGFERLIKFNVPFKP